MNRMLPFSLALRFGWALLVAWVCPAFLCGDDQAPRPRQSNAHDRGAAASFIRWLTTGTSSAQDDEYPATHRQTGTLKVFDSAEQGRSVASFCLDPAGYGFWSPSSPILGKFASCRPPENDSLPGHYRSVPTRSIGGRTTACLWPVRADYSVWTRR